MKANQTYYLLALSHKHVRLYFGDKYGLQPLDISNLPESMEAALHIDEYPKNRETHTIGPVSAGKNSRAWHEQYDVSQADKAMLQEFFRRIDKRLHAYLLGQKTPLVLAGVHYLLPIYRSINTYPYLAAQELYGNTEKTSLADIHERIWPLAPFSTKKHLVHV